MTNTELRTKIFQIVWFITFGLFASAMVLIAKPFAEALGIFMAYILGGLAAFAISLPKKGKE